MSASQNSFDMAEFMLRLGHELRTPLNAVLGYAHLMQTTERQNEQSVNLTRIQQAGERLDEVISGVLAYGESLKPIEQSSVVLLTTELVVERLQTLALDLGVHMTWEIQNSYGFCVRMDFSKLHAVVLSILQIVYLLKIKKINCELEIKHSSPVDSKLVLRIYVDSLYQILEDGQQFKIFEPFGMAQKIGLGLDLPIAKNICTQLGGDLDLIGDYRGFEVALPVQLEQKQELENSIHWFSFLKIAVSMNSKFEQTQWLELCSEIGINCVEYSAKESQIDFVLIDEISRATDCAYDQIRINSSDIINKLSNYQEKINTVHQLIIDYIPQKASLRFEMDLSQIPDRVRQKVLQSTLSHYTGFDAKLWTLYRSADWQKIAHEIHAFKGVALTFRAQKLAELAQEIYDEVQNSQKKLWRLFILFSLELRNFILSLRFEVKNESETTFENAFEPPVTDYWNQWVNLLKNYDSEARNIPTEIKNYLNQNYGFEWTKKVIRSLEIYDYDSVSTLLNIKK